MYRGNLNRRVIGLEKCSPASSNLGEIIGEEFIDCFYWEETIKRKMRKPITPAAVNSLSTRQMQLIVNLAWFDNPRRPVKVSLWDEAAREKMRKPVRANGDHKYDDVRLAIMIGLAGS